jgi:MFS family permease
MHRRHPEPGIDARIRASLRFSIAEGAAFNAMVGSAEGYFQAFAVFLKATVFQVGLASTLPVFLASVVQLAYRPVLSLLGSRKRFNVGAGILRTALFVPLALVPFMGPARVWILLALTCLYFSLNYLPNPAWTSWIGDLVDESSRGTFLGRRSSVGNLVFLAASVASGLLLQLYSSRPLYGFVLVFNLAFLACAASTLLLSLQFDPAGSEARQHGESFLAFARELPRSNYGRFVILNFVLYFGAYISSPFIVPFMLRELDFSYMQFMIATSLISLLKFLFMPLWGELGDRYGSKKVLALSTFLICFAPFTWLAARSFAWVCAIQVWGAFAWAGFEISVLAFAYDLLPASRVTQRTSFLLFYRGLATIGGGLTGGALLPRLSLAGSSYMAVFVVSGLFRLVLVLPLLALVREVRSVERISYPRLALKLLLLTPRAGLRWLFPGSSG